MTCHCEDELFAQLTAAVGVESACPEHTTTPTSRSFALNDTDSIIAAIGGTETKEI